MAISRFAIQSGNWSDPNIWDNGVVPGVDDIVYSNGFNITLDQDVNVYSLRNSQTAIYVPDIATPIMTSNTSPSGEASTNIGSSNAYLAFDQSFSVLDFGNVQARAIEYKFPSSKIIKRYAIRGDSTQNENPRIWTFDGSDDGITWTTIHSVSLATAIAANAWYDSGILSNTTSYLHYRVNVTATGGSGLDFVELQMTEATTAVNGSGVGGQFIVNSARNITCVNISNGNATPTVDITATSGNININAEIYGNSGPAIRISNSGCDVYIVGDVYSSNTTNISSILRSSGGYLNIIGNIWGRVTNSRAITINDTGTLDITGNINLTGGVIGNCFVIRIENTPTVNIVGNIECNSTSSNNRTIFTTAASTINITGNITGGGASSGNISVYLNAGTTLNVTGNVTGGSTSGSNYSIYNDSGSPQITVIGIVTAVVTPAITSTSSGALANILGRIINNNQRMALYVWNLYISPLTDRWELYSQGNIQNFLYPANTITGMPLESDVINGVVYGPANDLTGTFIVPNPSDVRKNIQVGNTVGTAEITAQDFLTELTNSSDPLAERLRNVVTTSILGNQLAAFTN